MDIKVGDRVRVSQWGGPPVVGIVTEVCEDVKNGRPGIDFEVPDAECWTDRYKWAYMYQVKKIS